MTQHQHVTAASPGPDPVRDARLLAPRHQVIYEDPEPPPFSRGEVGHDAGEVVDAAEVLDDHPNVAQVVAPDLLHQLGVVALYIFIGKLGWNGELQAVIVPSLVSAFGVFYMRQFIIDAVPDELIEAARVDGASDTQTFFQVVFPVMRPINVIVFVITFIESLRAFDIVWVVNKGRNGLALIAAVYLNS